MDVSLLSSQSHEARFIIIIIIIIIIILLQSSLHSVTVVLTKQIRITV